MTTTTALRAATINDIIHRLTGTPYKATAATPTALGGGMGPAQHDIITALNDAIDAGLVHVAATRDTSYGRGIRFVTLADGIHHCPTCITGCDHTAPAYGDNGSCGHRMCWGRDATSDCPGRAYADWYDRNPGA